MGLKLVLSINRGGLIVITFCAPPVLIVLHRDKENGWHPRQVTHTHLSLSFYYNLPIVSPYDQVHLRRRSEQSCPLYALAIPNPEVILSCLSQKQ